MKTLTAIAAALVLAVSTTIAVAGGYFEDLPSTTADMPLDQLTGNERIPMDTQLSQGRMPQTIAPSWRVMREGMTTTDSDATNPVMTVAGMSGAPFIQYRLTGAPTANQTLTFPTVADTYAYLNNAGVINALPYCWTVKWINVGGTSSGTFTLTTATGWGTLANGGNLVVPVAGSRTGSLCITSATAATYLDMGN